MFFSYLTSVLPLFMPFFQKMTANGTDSVESAILKQLEYYFGNINLPRDKFLQEKMKEDSGCKYIFLS